MIGPVITLTTDFGSASPYVAVMKGVILSINSAARILDLSHAIRPQDLRHADYFLGTAVPYFPPGTIHLCVVDPGVGSDRAALCVESRGQIFLAPDNGVLTGCLAGLGRSPTVRRLDRPQYWRPDVSQTFHGRDVFAPVAAHLSRGVSPADVGTPVRHWVTLPRRPFRKVGDGWEGEVRFVDDFGNLITNIPAGHLPRGPARLTVGEWGPLAVRPVQAYSEARPGDLVLVRSSDNYVEIAAVNGSAAGVLGAAAGTLVRMFPR